MEDPHVFDLWASVDAERREAAKQSLERLRPELTRLQVLQDIARAEPVRLASAVGYGAARAYVERAPDGFRAVEIYTTGHAPGAMHQHCAIHQLHHNLRRCPVCAGFYQP